VGPHSFPGIGDDKWPKTASSGFVTEMSNTVTDVQVGVWGECAYQWHHLVVKGPRLYPFEVAKRTSFDIHQRRNGVLLTIAQHSQLSNVWNTEQSDITRSLILLQLFHKSLKDNRLVYSADPLGLSCRNPDDDLASLLKSASDQFQPYHEMGMADLVGEYVGLTPYNSNTIWGVSFGVDTLPIVVDMQFALDPGFIALHEVGYMAPCRYMGRPRPFTDNRSPTYSDGPVMNFPRWNGGSPSGYTGDDAQTVYKRTLGEQYAVGNYIRFVAHDTHKEIEEIDNVGDIALEIATDPMWEFIYEDQAYQFNIDSTDQAGAPLPNLFMPVPMSDPNTPETEEDEDAPDTEENEE